MICCDQSISYDRNRFRRRDLEKFGSIDPFGIRISSQQRLTPSKNSNRLKKRYDFNDRKTIITFITIRTRIIFGSDLRWLRGVCSRCRWRSGVGARRHASCAQPLPHASDPAAAGFQRQSPTTGTRADQRSDATEIDVDTRMVQTGETWCGTLQR